MSVVATFTSANGQHRVDFDRAPSGLVRFTELVWREAPAPWDPDEVDRYWAFGEYSGLYASLEEAQAAAQRQLPWLSSADQS